MIYKYRKSNINTLKILIDDTVYFSQASEFNDPYDCYASFNLQSNIDAMIEKLSAYPKYSQEVKDGIISLWKNQPDSIDDIEAHTYLNKHIQGNALISCFSKTYTNRLMWSHYTENHKGIVVGYNTETYNQIRFLEFINGNKNQFLIKNGKYYLELHNINYSDSLVEINTFDSSDNKALQTLTTKDTIWDKEEEVRLIIWGNTNERYYTLPKNTICKVYFGAKMDINEQKMYTNLINQKNELFGTNIEMYKMNIDHKTYNLVETQIKK